jgi:hypothetical protein
MKKLLILLALPVLLTACVYPDEKTASQQTVVSKRYVAEGPAQMTLFTMISNRTGRGAHTGLMINGSQRVIWDPAGTFTHSTAPEIGDVHYGITNGLLRYYIDYHARETYHVQAQTVIVSRNVADMAIALFEQQGAAAKATCSLSTSGVLAKLPGFEHFHAAWFPDATAKMFGKLPGVVTQKYYDNDRDDRADLTGRVEG